MEHDCHQPEMKHLQQVHLIVVFVEDKVIPNVYSDITSCPSTALWKHALLNCYTFPFIEPSNELKITTGHHFVWQSGYSPALIFHLLPRNPHLFMVHRKASFLFWLFLFHHDFLTKNSLELQPVFVVFFASVRRQKSHLVFLLCVAISMVRFCCRSFQVFDLKFSETKIQKITKGFTYPIPMTDPWDL